MSDPAIWLRLQNTVLPPSDPEDLNSIAGVMRRRALVKDRIRALNSGINAYNMLTRHDAERERRDELVAERDSLVEYLDRLNVRYDELDGHRQQRFHRAFRTIVRRHVGEVVFERLVADANAMMDAAQERAKRALVGSAVPVLGAAGSPRERQP